MASINADNGVVSGITGVVTTADNTGNLALQANGVTLLTVATNNTSTFGGSVSLSNIISSANIVITSTASNGTIGMNASTGGLIVPTGTTAQRPGTPAAGTIRYNTTTSQTEVYSGNAWIGLTSQNYTIDYLIVAGGGAYTLGSGGYSGGYGGAGGLLTGNSTVTGGSTYTMTVGAGGAYSSTPGTVVNGGNSAIVTVATAIGGGGGGTGNPSGAAGAGASGGSGGGGGGGTTSPAAGGSGTAGQGYAGGSGALNGYAGGGGGAGGVGGNATNGSYGNGGAGVANSISGTSTTYARGAGADGTPSTANSGNGGGGTLNSGASGIIIISYSGTTQRGTGGTVTTVGNNTVHTFTSSGTYTA